MVSRNYFDSVIKSLNDSVVVIDKEDKIMTVNPAIYWLLGYTKEDLLLQPISIIFGEETDEVNEFFQFSRKYKNKLVALNSHDAVYNCELGLKAKDGRIIPVLLNAGVLTNSVGTVGGLILAIRDTNNTNHENMRTRRSALA